MNAAVAPDTFQPHIPVLLDEVMAALGTLDGRTVVDGTFGAGGYSRAILARGARVIGIDRDPSALASAETAEGLVLIEGHFGALDRLVEAEVSDGVDAVVLDIGVSSMQLDQAVRGFSFMRDGPLDMRMSSEGRSAADLVAGLDEGQLADLIYGLGEERAARRIARAIVKARAQTPVETTLQLAEIVASCLPRPRPGQLHPATRTFQALRIAVNDELGELVRGLAAAERVLRPGGRLVVVTFHSLEDRIVKRYLQAGSAISAGGSRHGPDRSMPPARFERPEKPVAAGRAETERNPRARSARLRWAVRTDAAPVALDARALGLPKIAGELP